VKIEFGPDWSEFLTLLISHRVRFVLVGGHAVAGHGEPRLTEDLDVFVQATEINARKLRRVLMQFGFGDSAPSVEQLALPDKIWMLGRKPWRIDILTSIDGVTFADAWRGRVRAGFGPSPLPVIGLRELLRNKRASGRPKDIADVARLEELARKRPVRKAKRKPGSGSRSRP
jgi:hypothetical protein